MTKQRTLNVFLGLPTATLMGSESGATQKAAQGFMSGPHRWMADDVEHHLEIGSVMIASQPVGAMFDDLLTDKGEMPPDKKVLFKSKEMAIFSIGMNTVEMLVVAQGAPVERFTTSENIGVRRISLLSADAGVVGAYVHGNNRIAVLVALSGGDADLARDVAMHVAAANPQVVSPADMPAEAIAKEREIYTAQAQDSGKPAEIVEKMIGGRIKKFLAENSLVEQAFVKDPDITVGKLVAGAGAAVTSFVRFEVGEGIVVEKVDFAEEVAAQLKG